MSPDPVVPAEAHDEDALILAVNMTVKKLGDRLTDAQKKAKDLSDELEKAKKAARLRTLWIVILGAVTTAVLALSLVTFYTANQSRHFNQRIQQQSVVSCEAGNDYRAEQTRIWDFFISALVSQPVSSEVARDVTAAKKYLVAVAGTDPKLRAQALRLGALLERFSGEAKDPNLPNLVRNIEAYIARVNAPRDCTKAFANTASVHSIAR